MGFINNYFEFSLKFEELLIIFFFLLFLSPLFILALNNLCFKLKILDIPNIRKKHKKPIPLSGGIFLCISSTLIFLYLKEFNDPKIDFYLYNLFFIYFFLLGLVDDLKSLNTNLKYLQ